MKKILSIIGVLFLFGCSDRLPGVNYDGGYGKPIYTIISISTTQFNDIHYCDYKISTNGDFLYWQDNYVLHDSIGKFNIGDTIKLKGIK